MKLIFNLSEIGTIAVFEPFSILFNKVLSEKAQKLLSKTNVSFAYDFFLFAFVWRGLVISHRVPRLFINVCKHECFFFNTGRVVDPGLMRR